MKAADATGSLKIGVVKEWVTNNSGTNEVFKELLKKLAKANIAISEISLPSPTEQDGEDEFKVLLHELRDDLAEYLAARPGN